LSIGIFWFFRAVESLAVRAAEGFVIQGLLFFIVIGATAFIITLPFSIYSTFASREEIRIQSDDTGNVRCGQAEGNKPGGCNRYPHSNSGSTSHRLVCLLVAVSAIGVIVFELLAQLIFPTVILPIFYKLKPLDDEDLMGRLRVSPKKAGLK
jgi:STE24 endopeptidase